MDDNMPPEEGLPSTSPAGQQNTAVSLFPQRSLAAGGNIGSIEIESQRAIAEAQGKMVLARRFPRDTTAAYAELMNACKQKSLASIANYAVPRGESKVRGPSIRIAEEAARCWGNIDYGHRELSRTEGRSEVEVYAWDIQTNVFSRRQITVDHTIDTKNGPKKMRDEKEIHDKIANVASKQLRGRLLAVLPKWLIQSALEQCAATLAGNSTEPVEVRVRKMVAAFAEIGVTPAQLASYLEHTPASLDDIVTLTSVYTSLKEGAKVSDFFDDPATDPAAGINGLLGNTPAATPTQPKVTAPPPPAPTPSPAQTEPTDAGTTTATPTTAPPPPRRSRVNPASTAPAASPNDDPPHESSAAPQGGPSSAPGGALF